MFYDGYLRVNWDNIGHFPGCFIRWSKNFKYRHAHSFSGCSKSNLVWTVDSGFSACEFWPSCGQYVRAFLFWDGAGAEPWRLTICIALYQRSVSFIFAFDDESPWGPPICYTWCVRWCRECAIWIYIPLPNGKHIFYISADPNSGVDLRAGFPGI